MAKLGAGHAAAMGRMGLHELQAAVYPDSNVAQRAEYGTVGSPTQGEVANTREEEPPVDGGRDSIVDRHVREAEKACEREEPQPGHEPER